MVLYYKKEKKNNLESITAGGGGSSDSEILYYKVVASDKIYQDGDMEIPYNDLAVMVFSKLLQYINVISFKYKNSDKTIHLGRVLYITGSQDVIGESTYEALLGVTQEKILLGFRLLKSENTNYNERGNTQLPLVQGTLEDIITEILMSSIPPDVDKEEIEERLLKFEEFFLKPIKECFKEITREEYYNL